MIVKREQKKSIILPIIIVVVIFYIMMRILTAVDLNGGNFDITMVNDVLDKIYVITTPLSLTGKNIGISAAVALFVLMVYESYRMSYKKNIQENTYGSAEWQSPSVLNKLRDKNIENNIILTATEQVSKNPKVSHLNRHIILVGRPGTGKSKFFFEPNILNQTGTFIATDPKGELLRDCGYALKQKGYDIRVLNLDDKEKSNHYNPFLYIRKVHKTLTDEEIEKIGDKNLPEESRLKEDDVMILINVIFANTKSDQIQTQTGDPFWEKAEILFLQSIFYYMLEEYKDVPQKQNFTTVMNLIRLAAPDQSGRSPLNELFDRFAKKHGADHIAYKQWRHCQVAAASQKMMSTIVMTATARLACFNIKEVADLVDTDNMELDRIGMPIDEDELAELNKRAPKKRKNGKVAYFVITKPSDNTFNFIATIMYTQIFQIIDDNAKLCNGTLATNFDMYLDEFAQLGEIPLFYEELAYVRSLGCGIVICLQSVSQLKKYYEKNWETIFDCCDTTMLLGSNSKETLEYFVTLMGKKTWYKKSSGRTFSRQGSSSQNWDVVGRELVTIEELKNMGYGKCVMLISNIGTFASNLYDIKKHPYYPLMYDSWKPETKKYLYQHDGNKSDEDEEFTDIMHALGFENCEEMPEPELIDMSAEELDNIPVGDTITPNDLSAMQEIEMQRGRKLATEMRGQN